MSTATPVRFDWKEFVAKNKPSSEEGASISQRARQQLLTAVVLPDLGRWASCLNLQALWADSQLEVFKKRLYGSAFTGVFSLIDLPKETDALLPLQAQIMARYTIWLFALDNFLDSLGFDLNHLEETSALKVVTPYVEAIVEIIAAPVAHEIGQQQIGANQAYLLDKGAATSKAASCKLPALLAHKANVLKTALNDIYQSLGEVVQSSSIAQQAEARLVLKTFCKETYNVIKAMQAEIEQGLAYRLGGEQADLETYLNTAKFSICLGAAASVAFVFEPRERQTGASWLTWQAAIDPGAKALRLINDCTNYQRELEEGKVNALTITLAGLGFRPAGAISAENLNQNPLLVEALGRLKHRIAQELKAFSDLLPATASARNKLDYSILSCVAFTMALYQERDYELA